MAFKGNFGRRNTVEKTKTCSCGGVAKMGSRKNYPFGKKSDAITAKFYKCKSCSKMTFIDGKGGNNNGTRR